MTRSRIIAVLLIVAVSAASTMAAQGPRVNERPARPFEEALALAEDLSLIHI